MAVPGPGEYHYNPDFFRRKIIAPNLNRNKTEKDTKIIKNNSPSPVSYEV
jgi:hypothetical protein